MILDLFAGPGGWSEGLRMIGLSDIGLEWDDAACRTRAAAGHRTVRTDVSTYPTEPFAGRVRGLIASPPCQAWSMAGKGAGRGEVARVHAAVELCRAGWTDDALAGPCSDPRTALILQPLRWAWDLRPAWIACEQVPPALGVWEHIADVLRGWGYLADTRVLCAADYGVPQTRDRAFLIATTGAMRWPEPTHAERPEPSLFGPGRRPWVTMAAALGWDGLLQTMDNTSTTGTYYRRDTDASAPVVRANTRGWKLRTNQKPPQMNGEYYARSVDRPAPHLTGQTGLYRWLRANNQENASRRRIDEPAPTLAFGHAMNEVGWVPEPEARVNKDGRQITESEASVLQGFRPDYPWQGNKAERFLQVGNAVCPPVAAAIIGALEGIPIEREAAA